MALESSSSLAINTGNDRDLSKNWQLLDMGKSSGCVVITRILLHHESSRTVATTATITQRAPATSTTDPPPPPLPASRPLPPPPPLSPSLPPSQQPPPRTQPAHDYHRHRHQPIPALTPNHHHRHQPIPALTPTALCARASLTTCYRYTSFGLACPTTRFNPSDSYYYVFGGGDDITLTRSRDLRTWERANSSMATGCISEEVCLECVLPPPPTHTHTHTPPPPPQPPPPPPQHHCHYHCHCHHHHCLCHCHRHCHCHFHSFAVAVEDPGVIH
jgi:hypothetical protein